MIELRLIERPEIPDYWPMLEPYFSRIPEKIETDITPESILQRARERRLLLYSIEDKGRPIAAAATGFIEAEGIAFIEAVAGDRLSHWLPNILCQFEDCARRANASRIRVHGRKGWLRKLRRFGYQPVSDDTTEKRLQNG